MDDQVTVDAVRALLAGRAATINPPPGFATTTLARARAVADLTLSPASAPGRGPS
jgi:MoxR-like ATPase